MEHMEQNIKKVEISRKITFQISENTSKKRNKNRNICYRFFFLAAAYWDRCMKSVLPIAACALVIPPPSIVQLIPIWKPVQALKRKPAGHPSDAQPVNSSTQPI